MRTKSFWLGVGVASAVWLWRKQLRPLAVQGAKGGLLVAEGIKDNIKAVRDAFFDLKQDTQMAQIRNEEKSESNKTRGAKEDTVEDL